MICNYIDFTIIEKSPFEVEQLDPEFAPIEELIGNRKKQYSRKMKATKDLKLINIDVGIKGPIGIAHFGDPHVDDDGTDLSQIIHYMNVISKTTSITLISPSSLISPRVTSTQSTVF